MERPIEPGLKYAPPHYRDNYILIRYVEFPGRPNYDGGLPGVCIQYGGKQQVFIACRDANTFWTRLEVRYCTELIT